jgi:hypothetical protein
VYRDVGSEPHQPDDPDFIEVQEVPFEPDAALLLCSDGLTDVVDSTSIQRVVAQWAGHPQQVVDSLIEAANAAGGKDNVTVIYVEGEQFAVANVASARPDQEITRRLGPPAGPAEPHPGHRAAREDRAEGRARGERLVRSVLVVLLTLVILLVVFQNIPGVPFVATPPTTNADPPAARVTVLSTQSLAQALQNARAGTTIVVAPGEYREMLNLKSYVRLVSQVPHGAILRLPGSAPESAAAIVATDVQEAAVEGFRVVGDAATPLGTAVLMTGSTVALSQVEITGATRTAIDVGPLSHAAITASDILDNPGVALTVRRGAQATISHSKFTRNGAGTPGSRLVVIEAGAAAEFLANVFQGMTPDGVGVPDGARAVLIRDNWFIDSRAQRGSRPPARGR